MAQTVRQTFNEEWHKQRTAFSDYQMKVIKELRAQELLPPRSSTLSLEECRILTQHLSRECMEWYAVNLERCGFIRVFKLAIREYIENKAIEEILLDGKAD